MPKRKAKRKTKRKKAARRKKKARKRKVAAPSQVGEINGLPVCRFKVADLLGAGASFNPRTITTRALDGLRTSVEEFGLVEPIVWNRRSGNIVGGHQRLKTLAPVDETDVIVVDLDDEREKALNLSLNNRHIEGDWTTGLGDLLEELGSSPLLGELNLDDLAIDVPEISLDVGDDEIAGLSSASSLEWVPLSMLRPHPRNYREHPLIQIEHLMESIRKYGFYRNLVATTDGTILAGHGVAAAARELEVVRVPVLRVDLDPEDPRALKILAADNEVSRLCEGDDRALSELLLEIKETVDLDGLLGTGFDEQMLANLVFVTRPESEIQDFRAASEWVGMPEYQERYDDEIIKVVVRFRNEEDRVKFAEKLGIDLDEATSKKTKKTRSIWYPPKKKEDRVGLRFEG